MHDNKPDNPNLITLHEVETRLIALEKEKEQLLTIKKQLQQKLNPAHSASFTPEQKIAIFRHLFRGRTDVFAYRWQSQQGKSGYSVACDNEWIQGICQKPRIKCHDCSHRQLSEFNDDIVYRHLTGQLVAGIYPLMHDNSCYFLAADFDKGQWREEVQAMSQACQHHDISHVIEISRSGNGAHLWIFFDDIVPAKTARLLGFSLLDKAMEIYPNLSFESYDRLFPNQDIMPEGGFGNLIALPLQREARLSGNSLFVDYKLTAYQDQWHHLAEIKPISLENVIQILSSITPNSDQLAELDLSDTRPPWEITAKAKVSPLENLPSTVTITLANHVYFELKQLPTVLIARLRRIASFSNPAFFKTQALRFSTHGIPRYISCARIERGYLSIPRGCFDEAYRILEEHNIEVVIDDKRQCGSKLSIKPLIKLRKEQATAVKALSQYDTGILHAPTAFGKTVTAISMISKRKTNALILVHSRQLLDQWKQRLQTFLPELNIGIIGGGKNKPFGMIDIATYQSLINKKDNSVSDLIQDYGHIIIDECHHISAPRYEMVLNEARAKYVLGLTATPERQDGHQKIIFMAAGPIRHKVQNNAHHKFDQQVIVRQLHHEIPSYLTSSEDRPKISDAYRWILDNETRNQRIIKDILISIQHSKHPLVLTERREHAEIIHTALLEKGVNSVVMKGAMRAAERKKIEEALLTAQVVVATGKYVGEGFDLPRLDTLFLAMPIAWKGSLAQYAGRIQRESDGKQQVTIYDYVDSSLPMLQRMFNKREKSYTALGYQIKFQN